MVAIPVSCQHLFKSAGWFPGRTVEVRFDRVEVLRSFPIAAGLLREYGGLRVGKCGPGRDCATSDIEFTTAPSLKDRDAVSALETAGDDLFPIGSAHHRHMELFVDSAGRLVAYGVPDGKIYTVGESIIDGIERLLLGYRYPGTNTAANRDRRTSGEGPDAAA
jgi:hypothetical protein